MGKIGLVRSVKDPRIQDAQAVLDEVKSKNPDLVVVFMRADGVVSVAYSSLSSVTEVIGALQRTIIELHSGL